LTRTTGQEVAVSPVLFRALEVACEVAALTDGVFDPTVGRRLELLGFNRHYLTGETISSDFAQDSSATFRDITLLEDGFRVRLEKPLGLDLGAVAKGLAVDVAARELSGYEGFAIDAGGDVFVGGIDPHGSVWQVGVENPLAPTGLLTTLRVTNSAVCTSGSYKRRSARHVGSHHLIDARSGESPNELMSCTVVAPQTILADVAATAAFLLGEARALDFISGLGLDALIVTQDGTVRQTAGMEGYRHD
jgi:thiamine biosynthesis lipoprotein